MFTALINNNLRLHDDVKFVLKTILQTKLVFYIFLTDCTGADLEILDQGYSFQQFFIRIYFEVNILFSGSKCLIRGQNIKIGGQTLKWRSLEFWVKSLNRKSKFWSWGQFPQLEVEFLD